MGSSDRRYCFFRNRGAYILVCNDFDLSFWVSAESVSYHWDVYCWKRRRFQRFSATFYFALCNTDGRFFPELTRYIRASATQQVSEDYVVVQQAFHATKWQIFSRHISRNVLIPIVTQIGLALPMLVTGAIITETIYGWPGVGPYLMSATKSLDYPVIMAIMLLSATLVILGNLLADVLYSIVDPRIRKGGNRS